MAGTSAGLAGLVELRAVERQIRAEVQGRTSLEILAGLAARLAVVRQVVLVESSILTGAKGHLLAVEVAGLEKTGLVQLADMGK